MLGSPRAAWRRELGETRVPNPARVPEPDAYPAFPDKTFDRVHWSLHAPLESPTEKSVLIVLAFKADAKGNAFPSLPTLARYTALTRRGVQKAIQRLEAAGWIVTIHRWGSSAARWPKSPAETLCPGCYRRRPRSAIGCPECGLEKSISQPIGGEPRSPVNHVRGGSR